MQNTDENFCCKPNASFLYKEFPENFLEIREFPLFFLENVISFSFPCDQQNFLKKVNFLKVGALLVILPLKNCFQTLYKVHDTFKQNIFAARR